MNLKREITTHKYIPNNRALKYIKQKWTEL